HHARGRPRGDRRRDRRRVRPRTAAAHARAARRHLRATGDAAPRRGGGRLRLRDPRGAVRDAGRVRPRPARSHPRGRCRLRQRRLAPRGRRHGAPPHRHGPPHGARARHQGGIGVGAVNVWFVLVAVVLLAMNGVFVAIEFSLIASRRTRLESQADEGNVRARYALEASGSLPLQLASTQFGITLCSLGLGAVAEPTVVEGIRHVLDPLSVPDGVAHVIALVLGLGLVVFLHMVYGEVVPRYLSLADPERMLLRLAIPSRVYVVVFRPVIRAIQAIGNAGTRLLGVQPREEIMSVHTADEIARMLADSREEGLIEETAHELLTGALDFGERP